MAVFFEELADSRKKDAKYHGSNLNYKLAKKTDGICVAGAALWDACCSLCGRRWALEV